MCPDFTEKGILSFDDIAEYSINDYLLLTEDIEIDSEVLNPEDKEMIQDTIVAAINDVMRKIDEETQDVMGAFTGGMGMPGLF